LLFFGLTLLIAIAILVSAYTPRDSVVAFALAVIALATLATVALSALLWLGWRLAGATRHYLRLLVVLSYQMALIHLIGFTVMSVLIVGVDLRSRNIVGEILDEAMKPGTSSSAAVALMWSRLESLVDGSEVRIALALASLLLLMGLIWIISSWGAYRDASALAADALSLPFCSRCSWRGRF
jgi:hypothetical protein